VAPFKNKTWGFCWGNYHSLCNYFIYEIIIGNRMTKNLECLDLKYIVFIVGLGTMLVLIFSSCSDTIDQDHTSNHVESQNNGKIDKPDQSIKATDFANHDFFRPISADRITHIHGLGYPNNQGALFIATHHGLKVYSQGKWFETVSNNHDFMGFQATASGFYSSGHPEKGSDLENPLGLLRSEDLGESLQQLSFYGESDFHHMSASYFSESIYVVNTHPNSKIGSGLYFSQDMGRTWTESEMEGLPATSAHALATHPKLAKIIGISTPEGMYLSHDSGNSFSLVSEALPVGALLIKDESVLYVIHENNELQLLEQSLESDDTQEIKLPPINNDDAILYLAVNPHNEDELSICTVKGSVWMTKDNGKNWLNIITEEKLS
jgi:hypothetical protein